tara:strand:+ start:251 stop:2026 length:1776 start_codon:yes stop_codon:yes gene_type:complete
MAEKIVSPGVFTRENDLSFLPAGIGLIGAAVVGPTVKGRVGIPTLVTSYAEYVEKFGNTFQSGSDYYQYLTSHMAERYLQFGAALTVVRVAGDNHSVATASVCTSSAAASELGTSFKLHTLGSGTILNGTGGTVAQNGLLSAGTMDNFRYEVSGVNVNTGTFNLAIRRGDDVHASKIILEQYNNINLDPNSTNYIGKAIGDSVDTIAGSGTADPYIQSVGEFPNKSSYVRVEVLKQTVDYLDADGNIRVSAASASLPANGSGSLGGVFGGGADGGRVTTAGAEYFYDNITSDNSQGFDLNDLANTNGGKSYADSLQLLQNQDQYDINMLVVPGANQKDHSAVVNKAISVCEARGDCFAIVDPVPHGTTALGTVTDEASDYNSSYAAMYWPWVQISDNQLGKNVWVPPSVVMPGVMAYNDQPGIGAEWFAPAGLNRGGIVAVKAERGLTHANRDTLYEGRINPIATFPGIGVVAFGQKTLQKRASALDRINVRRLLINLKKFIASTSKYLVFENNTSVTRNRFLSTVVPYMEEVQANQGLYAFKVVMDGTNNTPDVIDRNIMKGDIFIQPAKAAEFIVVDFNIMPTGATFSD